MKAAVAYALLAILIVCVLGYFVPKLAGGIDAAMTSVSRGLRPKGSH